MIRMALFDLGALSDVSRELGYDNAEQFKGDCALLALGSTRDCVIGIMERVLRPIATIAVSAFRGLGLPLNE